MINEIQLLINNLMSERGMVAKSMLPMHPSHVFMSIGTYIRLRDYISQNEIYRISQPLNDEYFYGMKIVIANLPDMQMILGVRGD